MAVKFYELMEPESRSWTLERTALSKQFTFIVKSDEFLSLADTQTIPDSDTILYLDDAIMQEKVIPYFRSELPLVYEFRLSESDFVYLYVASINAKQIDWETWRLDIVFDIPEDNGQSQGGGGGDTGPSDGEANSQEFTQLSFNSSVTFENRPNGWVMECQRATGLPGSPVYPTQRLRPIGLTEDGIKGADQPVRSFTFEITAYMPPSKITYAYMRRIARMSGCVNEKTFFGFAPTSVMCLGGGATGHLYQNIPVTLQFEVRTNFKIRNTGAPTLAPIADVVVTDPMTLKKTVNVATQFDTYVEPEFPNTAITHTGPNALPTGVHSGWSIVSYLYAPEIKNTEKVVIRKPTDRIIYLPEDVRIVNFEELLL